MSRQLRNKKTMVPPDRLDWPTKAMLVGLPFILLGVLSLVTHFSSIRNQSASVSRIVDKWRALYHLNDAQAANIQQIELDFHGNGSPFSISNIPTAAAKRRHHEDISKQMSPKDGENFIKMMETGRERH